MKKRSYQELLYQKTDFDPRKAEKILMLIAEGIEIVTPADIVEDHNKQLATSRGQLPRKRIFQRLSLSEICSDYVGISLNTLNIWLARYPDFYNQYRMAQKIAAHRLMDESLDIVDETARDIEIVTDKDGKQKIKVRVDVVNRAKLRAEQRRFIASKWDPDQYGDKVQVTNTNINANLNLNLTVDEKKLKLRNLIEHYKRRGVDVSLLLRKVGFSESNLANDFMRTLADNLGEQMMEQPLTLRVPLDDPTAPLPAQFRDVPPSQ